MANAQVTIAAVLPCYRVGHKILPLLQRIGPEISHIYVVDDACPDGSGALVQSQCDDPRVQVIFRRTNGGVGAACCSGFAAALADGIDIVVKLDGDGQMDPALIPDLCHAIIHARADVVKGNRFHRLGDLSDMPKVRLVGNAALSLLSKLSTGYWQLFDPTNGFIAIHRHILRELNLTKLAPRYFFESDLLLHLSLVRAKVSELPMRAVYADEISSLRPLRQLLPFAIGHVRNFARRLLYQYVLRGFSLASVQLLLSVPLLLFGTSFGVYNWYLSVQSGVAATAGTVMLAALPLILGVEMLLSWLNYDVQQEPRDPVWPLLREQ